MRIFMRVVEAGGFAEAARQLDLSVSKASRAVTQLERELNVRLLHRTTRSLALTAAGERYMERCREILERVDAANEQVIEEQHKPAGRLRVHSIVSLAQHYIIPLLARYSERYPAVTINLTLSQRFPDIVDEGHDVVHTVADQLPNSGLVVQTSGRSQCVLCASPDYLKKRKAPVSVSQLAEHDCLEIVHMLIPRKWRFIGPKGAIEQFQPTGNFVVNVPEALAIAVQEGMGIGLVPAYVAVDGLRRGALIELLPQYRPYPLNIYALHLHRDYVDARTRSWLAFVKGELPKLIKQKERILNRRK